MNILIECEQFTLEDIVELGKWLRNELPDHYHIKMVTEGGDIPLEEVEKIIGEIWKNDPHEITVIRKEEANG